MFAGIASLLLSCAPALAAPCAPDAGRSQVTGVSQCLLIREFGSSEPETLLIWLHGDVSSGGPANYHFPIAQKAAEDFAERKLRSIAMVRPGYPDGSGQSSSVSFLHGGRRDHYTAQNIEEVIGAIRNLQARYAARQVVVVGHSGGAAMAASLLGMAPGLVQGAVLVACPCDLTAWRVGRSAWGRSEDPIKWAERTPSTTRVIALTGEDDANTVPQLAQVYIEALQKSGVSAVYQGVPNEGHNSIFRSIQVSAAIESLLKPAAK
jgi:predicted esterase